MSALLLALIVAAVVCGIMWRRPDARAVASGAWQAGKAQAIQEFRGGYYFAQKRLRDGNPSWKNPRRWVSWGLAGAYGGMQTVAAANRIRRRAWQGARDSYADWKASQPVDAEVVEEVEEVVVEPGDPNHWPEPPDPQDEPAIRSEPESTDNNPPGPDPGPEPNQEGPDVQTEASGLTSYAHAHSQLADELRAQMTGSENLAASMSDVLAEHSDLIGDTAVLQDHINQAAAIAQRIADRSLTVANN